MDIWNIEGNVSYLYDLAGAEEEDPPGTPELALRILGSGALRYVPDLSSPAQLSRVMGRFHIFLRCGIDAREIPFLVGHELAEWFYRHHRDDRIEDACNSLGAALVTPKRTFASVLRQLRTPPRIARAFVCSETLVHLRIAETTGRPTALVSPHKVWIKGEPGPWPRSETALRQMALQTLPPPGIKKARMGDHPRRVALFSTN